MNLREPLALLGGLSPAAFMRDVWQKRPLLIRNASANDVRLLASHRGFLERLAGLDCPRELSPGETPPASAAAVVGEMTLLVPMAGLIDPAAELARLTKRLGKTRQEIAKATAKLGNANFVANAPPEVVATERERIAQFEMVTESLARQIQLVQGLL